MTGSRLEMHGIDPLRDTIEFAPTSFAQYGEDLILWRALNDITRGFYIDVGAMDPIRNSVTKLFYDRGWNGINIEPVRKWVNRLVKHRPLDITVPLAVSDGRETVTLHEVLDTGLSTVVDDFARDYADKGLEVRTYKVAADTISAICERHVKGQIHFMKIDVEGAERDALVGCNFQRFRPWILAMNQLFHAHIRPPMKSGSQLSWPPDIALPSSRKSIVITSRKSTPVESIGYKSLVSRLTGANVGKFFAALSRSEGQRGRSRLVMGPPENHYG